MKIAQVAPLYESVPPKYYGGTERIVSYLTEELVRRGHEVTLFASGDSQTRAHLEAPCTQSLRLNEDCLIPEVYNLLMLEHVFKDPHRFDVIHFHIDYVHFPLSRRHRIPHVTTLHGRLDFADLVPLYRTYPEVPVVSISNAQRASLPWLNWQQTIYHGLPDDLYTFREQPGDYLAFVGRICPEKRVDRAVEIARRTGMPLKVAAKVDPVDRQYFKDEIAPLFEDPLVEYIGEVGEGEKDELLGNAYALLFPIDWPEPFGLVMIEAFACGTPVIAYPHGSVPEIMEDGASGFIVNDLDEAVRAVEQAATLDRARCRRYFEERFTDAKMTEQYLGVSGRLAGADGAVRDRRSGRAPLRGAGERAAALPESRTKAAERNL